MRYTLAVAIASVTLGCSFEGAPVERVENRCSTDIDCAASATCDADLGMCVTPVADDMLRVALEVTPPTDALGGTPTTHIVGPLEISEPTQNDLVLPAAISVFGKVRASTVEGPVIADIQFIRKDTFEPAPPRPQVSTSTLTTPVEAADGMLADYSINVLAEREFDVVIKPTGAHAELLPPLRRTVSVPGGGDLVRLDFEYPADMPVVSGVVVAPGEEMGEFPVGNLQVQAVEPGTGRVLSSTDITESEGPEQGTFSVILPAGIDTYVLRISGTDLQPFPTLLADPAYFFPDGGGPVRILVPNIVNVCYRGRVEGPGGGVEDATVSFRSVDVFDDTTGVVGSFSTTSTTDRSGVFRVDIPVGRYEVIVTPPSGVYAELGVSVETMLRIEEPAPGTTCNMGQLFELPERAVLGGVVQAPDGEPLSGATVLAAALGRMGEVPAARFNRSNEAVTDPTGQFRLPLDFGTYDIVVKPPSESGYPWLIRPTETFASSTTVRDSFELSAPVPLRGTVLSANEDGTPLGGSEIRAWGLIREADGSTRVVQIGRATADEDGSYTLLLPARL